MKVKILDFLKNEWSNWLLADTRGTTLTDFSSFLGWRLKGDSNVTYDPVEKGYFVAYNKTIMPLKGRLRWPSPAKALPTCRRYWTRWKRCGPAQRRFQSSRHCANTKT